MPTQRFDLSGKTALITGAAGLLGCEHAAALLECDATVVLTDISEQQLAETKRKLDIEFPLGNILHTRWTYRGLRQFIQFMRRYLIRN